MATSNNLKDAQAASMTDTLTTPLITLSTISSTLFQSLSAPQSHIKSQSAPPPLSAFLTAETSLALALAQTASHQRRQKRIEALVAEIGELEERWREVVERVEKGRRELEGVVKEGEERVEGIKKAREGE